MDMCKYGYYKPEEKYFPYLYCRLENNKRCIYSKKCLKVEKFVPLENEMWRGCPRFIMDKINNIPKDSYFVQDTKLAKNGKLYLYIVIDENTIEKILSDFTELNQDYVYLKKINDNYKISLIPFKSNNVKNNKKEKENKEK